MIFTRKTGLRGELTIPGDKSISHRSVMFGSLAQGMTEIHGFLKGADCLSTINCFRQMGIHIEESNGIIYVKGNGLHGLSTPERILDVGNSGTTTRLMSGILSGQKFTATLSGDESLNSRPMKRIITPLSMMGAEIESMNGDGCAPLKITGKPLKGIHYNSPVASAQVKSAVLLAGLYAEGITSVTEPALSRNHTELMLHSFGASVTTEGLTASITPPENLYSQKILVPGDISSAAFFIVAGLITPNSEIFIKNVGINPTRNGILKVCEAMGADISYVDSSGNTYNDITALSDLLIQSTAGEPVADILVKTSNLHGTVIEGGIIPTLIDELPVIALLACFADGTTIIKDAQELKVKESNRIDLMADNLKAMGAHVTATEDGMIIEGGHPLHGTSIFCKYDHRIAMTFAIAGINGDGETDILDSECVNVSYPAFFEDLERLSL
ncbi:MAG: 3-phosphoshikimate 1-carboxyvinyltransferase [Lachnospiraceae bacterium]|nr:3-phosphoshikimate 1-carboxyvinyltransferase [Lachnospiraceae bacterium]